CDFRKSRTRAALGHHPGRNRFARFLLILFPSRPNFFYWLFPHPQHFGLLLSTSSATIYAGSEYQRSPACMWLVHQFSVHYWTLVSVRSIQIMARAKSPRNGNARDRKSTRLNSSHQIISY